MTNDPQSPENNPQKGIGSTVKKVLRWLFLSTKPKEGEIETPEQKKKRYIHEVSSLAVIAFIVFAFRNVNCCVSNVLHSRRLMPLRLIID